jgi:hypothetical protein
MTHQQLDIETTVKAGKTYNNIKPKIALDQDKFCLVRKKFAVGKEREGVGKSDGKAYKYFSHNVMLIQPDGSEHEVSFLLYEKENEEFDAAGGLDDTVRIWLRKDKTGKRKNPLYITFERV